VAPGFFATQFDQRIRAFLNVCLFDAAGIARFIPPDTYPKKLIADAARTAAMRCSKMQGGACAGPGGIDPYAVRMPGRIRVGETQMLRKMVMALAASAALALAAAPTDASARGGMGMGHGGGGFAHGGFAHGGFVHRGFVHGGFRRFGFFPHRRFFFAGAYPYYYGSCWRWVAGPWGLHRAWVCGYRPYAYY
jgi:hypothetical protein